MKKIAEYAIYKGDDFVFMGNTKECAKYLNVKEKSIYFYASETYRNRNSGNGTILVKVSD